MVRLLLCLCKKPWRTLLHGKPWESFTPLITEAILMTANQNVSINCGSGMLTILVVVVVVVSMVVEVVDWCSWRWW